MSPGFKPLMLTDKKRSTTDSQRQPLSQGKHDLHVRKRNTMATVSEAEMSSAKSEYSRKPLAKDVKTGQTACEAACVSIKKVELGTDYRNKADGPAAIFPLEDVKNVLLYGDTAEKTFYCSCPRCNRLSDTASDSRNFDKESLTGKFTSTFAMLISLNSPGLISHFQKKDIYLTDRPLEPSNLRFISELKRMDQNEQDVTIREIVRAQYMFHLKQFHVQHHSVDLSTKEALPIMEEKEEGKGAYGTVYSFKFLPGYTGESYKVFEPQKFARKVFLKTNITSGIDEFNNLLRIYRKGSSQKPEKWDQWRRHIMEALAGYTHGNIYFIIFPYAESTLAHYFRGKFDSPKFTPRDLWRQMEGIAGGLAFLHEAYLSETEKEIVSPNVAFHFDLKPENILIRNGIVMISDFGQSKFKKISEEESTSGIDSGRVHFSYGPPEDNFVATYDKSERKKSNYNFDIWSLGAIFSELMTCHVKHPTGAEALIAYRKSRRCDDFIKGRSGGTNTFFLNASQVKPAVVQQHKELRAIVEKKDLRHEEEKQNLWLESFAGEKFFTLIESMLSIITSDKQRPRAVKVQETLGLLCERAEQMADHHSPAKASPEMDIWQKAKNDLLWKELRGSSHQILCYRARETGSVPARCVVLMQTPINRKFEMKLLWQRDRSHTGEKEVMVNHTSPSRQTGVIPEYLNHVRLATNTIPADVVADPLEHGGLDTYLLDEERARNCYKLVPVINSSPERAALLFTTMQDILWFQANMTGQYTVSNFSTAVQGVEITQRRSFPHRQKPPEIINQKAHLQIWSDVHIIDLAPDAGQKFDRVPIIHVAIITRNFLYLFKINQHSRFCIPKSKEQSNSTITLEAQPKSDLSLHRIDLEPKGTIMVNIPEPAKHTMCEKVTLQFSFAPDTAHFWTLLGACQNLWAKLELQRRRNSLANRGG